MSEDSSDSISERCAILHKVIVRLTGIEEGNLVEVEESALLLSAYLKKNASITRQLRKSDVIGLEWRLSATEDVALCARAGVTGWQRRLFIRELHKVGLNPFSFTRNFDATRQDA